MHLRLMSLLVCGILLLSLIISGTPARTSAAPAAVRRRWSPPTSRPSTTSSRVATSANSPPSSHQMRRWRCPPPRASQASSISSRPLRDGTRHSQPATPGRSSSLSACAVRCPGWSSIMRLPSILRRHRRRPLRPHLRHRQRHGRQRRFHRLLGWLTCAADHRRLTVSPSLLWRLKLL